MYVILDPSVKVEIQPSQPKLIFMQHGCDLALPEMWGVEVDVEHKNNASVAS